MATPSLPPSLEDSFADIIRKARWGLGLQAAAVAAAAGLREEDLEALEAGRRPPQPAEVRGLARALGLSEPALRAIAVEGWCPRQPEQVPAGLTVLTLTAMQAHAYIWGDEQVCLVVDPGDEPTTILRVVGERRVVGILVTHGHGDHVGALPAVAQATGAPVYGHPDEVPLVGQHPFQPCRGGEVLRLGPFALQVLACPGHSPGGLAFVGGGLAFVGDTLFAGSLGRARGAADYPQLLASARRLLALPPATVLCPGHGPLTTVAEERRHNAFVAHPDEPPAGPSTPAGAPGPSQGQGDRS